MKSCRLRKGQGGKQGVDLDLCVETPDSQTQNATPWIGGVDPHLPCAAPVGFTLRLVGLNGMQEETAAGIAATSKVTATTTHRVVLLCGLPGSGKSHLARQIQQQAAATTEHVVIVEYDQLQSDASSLQAWHAARVDAMTQLDTSLQLQQGSSSTSSNQTILLDDNFHLKSMRKQVYLHLWEQQQQHRNESIVLLFGILVVHPVDMDLCLQRNAARPDKQRRVPEDVIHRMHDTFDVPSPTNYWEQSLLFLSSLISGTEEERMHRIQAFLETGLQTVQAPPTPTTTSSSVDPLTARQQADLLWRQAVKAVAEIERSKAGTANAVRQSLLRSSSQAAAVGRHDDDDDETNNNEWLLELFLAGDWLTPAEQQGVRERMRKK